MDTPRSFDSPGLAVPPSSFDSVQMPDVFVIPPEEEQAETPPFCYFDASKAALATEPDIESVDIALNVHQQIANTAPVFLRTSDEVVMPVRSSEEAPFPTFALDRSEDEDDIEVYKVGKEIPSIASKKEHMSKSKTFRARASQALRSIKNVGRPSRKQPTTAQAATNQPSSKGENAGPTTPSIASRAGKNTLPKRRTSPISQIFRSNQEELTTDAVPPSPTTTIRPTSPAFSTASPPLSPTSPRPSMQSSMLGSIRAFSPSPQPGPSRPTSPIHYGDSPASPDSLRPKSTSFRKRLSLLELPRLFSSSSTVSTTSTTSTPSTTSFEDPPSDVPPTPLPTTTSLARRSSKSSSKRSWTMSRSGDDDNEEEDYGEIQPTASLSMVKEEDSYVNEFSLEMRLDSLQFDSLSFDPNDFTMTSFRGHGTQIEVN
ncbi:hypothetical protein BJ322DRAFT_1029151 [Thelephora terrestris]|uniref:Uncharacterized protein n=1 Tax=Thelephora terrestris TaxID=56493 RepID=A0A9P6LC44_9AGAM|nr:hypothetical protein BJ322DRAFT_1029151 [Thelephora terrestris]